MVDRPSRAVTAWVTADTPLLRRGLCRVASAAGFTLVPSPGPADVSLRAHAHLSEPGTAIAGAVEIVVESSSVVVTLQDVPDLTTLVKVRGLLLALREAETTANG